MGFLMPEAGDMRRAIVIALARLCDLTHTLHVDHWGCRLATLSDDLDQRWQTGVWKGPQ